MRGNEETREYGKWQSSPELHFKGRVLEQKMRRRIKIYPAQGAAWTIYEYRWLPVPQCVRLECARRTDKQRFR